MLPYRQRQAALFGGFSERRGFIKMLSSLCKCPIAKDWKAKEERLREYSEEIMI